MTRDDSLEAIRSLIEDCMRKQMYGSITLGFDDGKVQNVDVREHLKIKNVFERSKKRRVVVIPKKEGNSSNNPENPDHENSQKG